MLTREELDFVVERLGRTSFAREVTLVGSAALYRLSTRIPPMTDDVDIAVPEDLLVRSEGEVRQGLEAQGFRNVAGTATWIDDAGVSLDILAHAPGEGSDRVGGGPTLRVMVFADLSAILADPRGRVPGAPGHLSAAGLVLSKLLTLRAEKGTKDRLHALLLLGERGADDACARDLAGLLEGVGVAIREDVLAEAQAACVALGGAVVADDPWLRGYADRVDVVRVGFERLQAILGVGDPGAGP